MQDKQVTKENEVQDKQLSAWRKPVIMRIELKRTWLGGSDQEDAEASTPP